jgi:gamma-butyrobetaine dioxygenase
MTVALPPLQTAWLARQAGSKGSLIVAALLHDVGHLLDDGIDHSVHEIAGYQWLLSRFGPSVAEPVRHHVAAKRYLCLHNPDYLAGLSEASVISLQRQGGPFNEEQAREFERLDHFREAVQLRRWDDQAKIPGLAVPGIEEYRDLVTGRHID